MRYFKNFLILLWRIYFYFLLALPIIVMFPFLLVSISRESWYPYFFVMARVWAKVILFGMGFRVIRNVVQEPENGKSYMFIANHTSMTDIMLMLSLVRNPFVFVGKKELVKIPLFGFFYKRTCILVDRNNSKSRSEVFKRAQQRLNQGLSICIFPEGGVPDDETILLDTFKDGAFRLAIDHQIDVIPLTFADNKKRFSYTFFSGSPGKMRATIHAPLSTSGLVPDDKKDLKSSAFRVIETELKRYQSA